jgi:hypothetical protein
MDIGSPRFRTDTLFPTHAQAIRLWQALADLSLPDICL